MEKQTTPSEVFDKIQALDEQIGIINRQIRWNRVYLTAFMIGSFIFGLVTGWVLWA